MADHSTNTTIQPPRISIALLSAGTLAYEILLMRLFSIIQWHHFSYMIISLALLGYGASGTFLTLKMRRLLLFFPHIFVINIALFGISVLVLFLLAQQIPFNAQEILWDIRQPGYLLLMYLTLSLPFFFAANAIGLALIRYRRDITKLYAADMFGAGLGCIGIVFLLFVAFPENCLRIVCAMGITAAAVGCWELRLGNKLKWLLLLGAILPLLVPATWVSLAISPYKGLKQTLRITGSEVIAEFSSPLGLLSIVESPNIPLRHAPGLSLNAHGELPAQLGIFTDADAMSVINQVPAGRDGTLANFSYLDQLTSALPYHLKKPQQVLILGAGGGSGILQARYHGVKHIEAVELNPQIVELMQKDYAQYSGNLYNQNKIRLHVADARGFVTSTQSRYDLIQVALLDAFSASSAGLYALSENYLYTVEALQDYLHHLMPNGYLAISRWVKLPPRDTLKLFTTAVAALQKNGVTQVAQHLVLIRSWQTTTLLIKNGSYNTQEIDALRRFCEQRAFDLAYYPGMKVSEANQYNRLREADYYHAAQALVTDQSDAYIKDYKFNIQPATDDKPYFYNFFRWSVLPEIITLAGRGGMPLLEWGYLVLIVTLLQAFFVSLVFIALPLLFAKRGRVTSCTTGIQRWQVLGYFLCLGLAFLFIEIAFIQKFVLLLHHPLYAVAVVLASFLMFAGIGSAYSKRYSQGSDYCVGIKKAAVGIVVLGLLYLFLLGPIFSLLLDWPTFFKSLAAIVLIAPLAFFMGMPFPLGLKLFGEHSEHLIPWAWGINGCASVLSAVLATLLALHFGFRAVVLSALVLYSVAALILIRYASSLGPRPGKDSTDGVLFD